MPHASQICEMFKMFEMFVMPRLLEIMCQTCFTSEEARTSGIFDGSVSTNYIETLSLCKFCKDSGELKSFRT